MNRSRLIYLGAAFAAFTCLIHLIGTFMPVPPEQTAVIAAVETMRDTLVPMPVGSARSYMQILNGNNYGTALLLLICAVQLIAIAKLPNSDATNRTLLIATFGLAGFTIISATHFFPIPALLTGIATLLCIAAFILPSEPQ